MRLREFLSLICRIDLISLKLIVIDYFIRSDECVNMTVTETGTWSTRTQFAVASMVLTLVMTCLDAVANSVPFLRGININDDVTGQFNFSYQTQVTESKMINLSMSLDADASEILIQSVKIASILNNESTHDLFLSPAAFFRVIATDRLPLSFSAPLSSFVTEKILAGNTNALSLIPHVLSSTNPGEDLGNNVVVVPAFLLMVAIIVAATGTLLIYKKEHGLKGKALRQIARRLRLIYDPEGKFKLPAGIRQLPILQLGDITQVLRSDTPGRQCAIFEHRFCVAKEALSQTIAAFHVASTIPGFLLKPEALQDQIATKVASSSQRIFTSPYRLVCDGKDEQSVLQVLFNNTLSGFFEREQEWTVVHRGNWVGLYKLGRLVAPKDLLAFYKTTKDIANAIEAAVRQNKETDTCTIDPTTGVECHVKSDRHDKEIPVH
jgi:hypothetical protein